jgi:hypothetical protein
LATRLIDREADAAALHRLLAGQRLVTVVGPGGVGKTRVALEVVRRSDVPTVLLLAPVTDPPPSRDRGPSRWLPPNAGVHCEYAAAWS